MPLDSWEALRNVRYSFRRHEEKAAANKLREAVIWLNYAVGLGLPIGKGKPEAAAWELTTVAKDLEKAILPMPPGETAH